MGCGIASHHHVMCDVKGYISVVWCAIIQSMPCVQCKEVGSLPPPLISLTDCVSSR